MYEQFFGLQEKPFSLTPDTDYYYRFRGHQEALNVLLVALRNGEGFMCVSGEVGTGKTLLCRQLLKMLQDDCATVYLPNPLLTPHELYQAIISELQLPLEPAASFQQLTQQIFTELVRLRQVERPLVVLIDEAQAMPLQSLEALRLLSNLETAKEKLLHIVFFAQPEFEKRLAREELRQLRQRIVFSYRLPMLQRHELSGYLEHRLRIAGCQGVGIFQDGAIRLLFAASRGTPRLVNLLAHKALLAAYGKGRRHIDRRIARSAVRDGLGRYPLPTFPGSRPMFAALGAVLTGAVLTLMLLRLLR